MSKKIKPIHSKFSEPRNEEKLEDAFNETFRKGRISMLIPSEPLKGKGAEAAKELIKGSLSSIEKGKAHGYRSLIFFEHNYWEVHKGLYIHPDENPTEFLAKLHGQDFSLIVIPIESVQNFLNGNTQMKKLKIK